MVSQGGTGAAAAGLGARQIYNTIYGVVGNKQIPEKIVYPNGIPTKLPKISPTTKVVMAKASPSPSASTTKKAAKK